MQTSYFVIALALLVGLCSAQGVARFTADDVEIFNRPFVQGTLTASMMWYDKAAEMIAWEYDSFTAGSLLEAYRYPEQLRVRKCQASCEAFGENRQVPDLVRSGGTATAAQGDCSCWNINPTDNNGQVDQLCYFTADTDKICSVRFSTGEEWVFNKRVFSGNGVNTNPTFNNNEAFLQTTVDQLSVGQCEDICSLVLDVMLVLDESGSIDNTEWNQLLDFALQLVDRFEIGPSAVNLGVALYSTNGRLLEGLSNQKDNVINQINNINKLNGCTCIKCGLEEARQELDDNGRAGVPKIIIILTDGRNNQPCDRNACSAAGLSNGCGSDCCRGDSPSCPLCGAYDELQAESAAVTQRSYRMVSIGVGDNLSQKDLDLISTTAADKVTAATFSDLVNVIGDLLKVVCPINQGNDCGVACNGACYCGQVCDCPRCDPQDMCHVANCSVNAGQACVQTAIDCDDGDLCTTDTCNPDTGCVFTDSSNDCLTPNQPCMTEYCDPQLGCRADPVVCTPQDVCHTARCDTGTDGCVQDPITDAICRANADAQYQTDCWTHTCDVAKGGCVRSPVDCDQANQCFLYSCNPNGGCQSTAKNCDLGDPCKIYDCDPATGCFATDKNCDDGMICTKNSCDMSGTCLNETSANCDKCKDDMGVDLDCASILASQINGDMCLEAACDLDGPFNVGQNTAGNCYIINKTANCNAGSACIIDGCDSNTGECTRTTRDCSSSNNCLITGCDPTTGCTVEDRVCINDNKCKNVTCDPNVAGGCVLTDIECDFGDPCMIYGCDQFTGCTATPKCPASINNCFNQTCVAGECIRIDLCDDKNECSDDSCDISVPGGQCVNTFWNVTERCNDHSVCTEDICDPNVPGGCVNRYMECPNTTDVLNCQVANNCSSVLGCIVEDVVCPPVDACHSAFCLHIEDNETISAQIGDATKSFTGPMNLCASKNVDSSFCDLGIAGTTGIALGVGAVIGIIIAIIAAAALASAGAYKAYDSLMASNMGAAETTGNPLYTSGNVEGESPIHN